MPLSITKCDIVLILYTTNEICYVIFFIILSLLLINYDVIYLYALVIYGEFRQDEGARHQLKKEKQAVGSVGVIQDQTFN